MNALAIPPAYTNVWICPNPNGHLQATGRDARGRKQYRYHARWKTVTDETKYCKMIVFAEALPALRQQVHQDLALPGMPKKKVLAALVHLLQTTLIRVGNEEYARHNQSFGLTTLRNHHAHITGAKIIFNFMGKSVKKHSIALQDKRLAKIIKRCKDLPGQDLFEYLDENGTAVPLSSTDVNAYLREITQDNFTAKDFRTWAGTLLAVSALQEYKPYQSESQAKRNIVQAMEKVAKSLGNTAPVCRKSYVHPDIFEAYLDQSLFEKAIPKTSEAFADLLALEKYVLKFLKKRLTP